MTKIQVIENYLLQKNHFFKTAMTLKRVVVSTGHLLYGCWPIDGMFKNRTKNETSRLYDGNSNLEPLRKFKNFSNNIEIYIVVMRDLVLFW